MEPKESIGVTLNKPESTIKEIANTIINQFDELDRMNVLRDILAIIKENQQLVFNERKMIAERSMKALESMSF